MNRVATWSRVGMDVSSENNLDSVLQKAGLDFTVSKKKIYTADGIEIPYAVSTVRDDTGESLGIVSPKYNICQNREAFDFVNYIDDDVKFVKAGMNERTGLIYIISSLPDVKILGDSFTPYVIFQNGHTGGFTVKAAISPLRIVCQNQFNMSFKDSESTVSIRHSNVLKSKMEDAREVLSSTANYMKRLNEEAEKYSKIKVSATKLNKIVEDLFPMSPDMKEKTKASVMSCRANFIKAYNCEDNVNFRGSAWGAVNAYSDYITHSTPSRMTKNWEENKFSSVTLNPSLMYFINVMNSHV